MSWFVDRVHRLPRIWSNRELERCAHLFEGSVVNVSAWKDVDKEGRRYRDYFTNASSYTLTNYEADARGFQGYEGEIFLDLEKPLPDDLNQSFDVALNHTTLEHVFEAKKAFENICSMSRDVVIIVLPWLQQYHTDYGDYWRFSPLLVKRLFEENGFEVVYQNFNNDKSSSVYVFTVATRNPEKWVDQFDWSYSVNVPNVDGPESFVGCRAIPNSMFRFKCRVDRLWVAFTKLLRRFIRSRR